MVIVFFKNIFERFVAILVRSTHHPTTVTYIGIPIATHRGSD